MFRTIFIVTALITSLCAYAEQTVIPNYDTARDTYFWDKLYRYGGWTLYCGSPFYAKGLGLQVEHVYPGRGWAIT